MSKLKATIDRFEGDKAVLILENKEKLIIAKSDLGFNAQEGDVIYLGFFKSEETADNENLAKNILQEILNKQNNA